MKRDRRPSVPYATHIIPAVSWSDLTAADTTLHSLRELADRATHDPAGVAALFSGGSRRSRVLAAEVVAGSLGTDLLTVDISAVVSKWLGETEKNLSRVFAVAERTQAVLLLDEADALFGARTETTDAHDRYSHQAVNFLIREIPRFPGVVILSTKAANDPGLAAIRRIAIDVRFHRRPISSA